MADRHALATAVMWAVTVVAEHWRGMLLIALAIALVGTGLVFAR